MAAPGLRLLGSWCAPAGARAPLSILIYHRVRPHFDRMRPDEVDASTFESHMTVLAESFHVLPLDEAVNRLRNKSLPARSACITFDDGYADNAELALPILRRLGLNATFFISTGYLDGGRMWNDSIIETMRVAAGPLLDLSRFGLGVHPIQTVDERRRGALALIAALKYLAPADRHRKIQEMVETLAVRLPDDLMMRREQVRALRQAGMIIGGHTVTHPILTRLDTAAAHAEIGQGKEILEGILGERVDYFAYPNGRPKRDYSAEHVKMVKELGFSAAVSTAWGSARADSDLYQLPRFTPWDQPSWRYVLRLFDNCRRTPAELA